MRRERLGLEVNKDRKYRGQQPEAREGIEALVREWRDGKNCLGKEIWNKELR